MALSDKLPPHINEASVEASVNKQLSLMESSGAVGRLLALTKEATSMLDDPSPEMAPRLDTMIKEIATTLAPFTPCKKGCSACCHMAVTVTSREAEIISKTYGIPKAKVVPTLNQEELIQRYMACKCPFLVANVCQIYEHRPSACRGFFNLSGFPELCDVIKYPGSDVPSVNLQVFWLLTSVVAFMSGDFGADIRDYFPEGLSPSGSKAGPLDDIQSL